MQYSRLYVNKLPCTRYSTGRLISIFNKLKTAATRFRCPAAAAAIALAIALVSGLPGTALAQGPSYPARLVRITTPYSTGSGPDLVARIFADKLAKLWGQQVVVDSKPGANGFIAFEAVKKAPPDGHDLLVSSNAQLTINQVDIMRLKASSPQEECS